MVNILVPTDFSPLSKVAVQYAIKIANKLHGNVTLLHVVTISKPTRATMHERIRDLEDDLIRFAERDLAKLVKEVSKTVKTTVSLKCVAVRNAEFTDAVKKEAKRLHSGLIVMGTKGASGLKKTVVGSNTTSIMEVSTIPVLAVPDKAQFKSFKDIIYASDLKSLERELKSIVPYAAQFGSTIHIVHVVAPGKDVDAPEEKIDKVVKKLGYENIASIVLADHDIEGAIEQYISVSKAGLLAMFTHNLTFYEKLFDRSITRNMAFHSRVPLLAFHKSVKGR